MLINLLLAGLVLVLLGLVAAGLVWILRVVLDMTRGRASVWSSVCLARRIVLILSLLGLGLGLVMRLLERDWVHLLWSAQLPMLTLFFVSGLFLCGPAPEGMPGEYGRLEVFLRSKPSAFVFLGLVALGLMPLALQLLLPEDQPTARDLGEPVRRLFELAAWGFGGHLPETLVPETAEGIARGVGHLPREVMAPMGSLLVAAWLWILFAGLALVGRLLRPVRARLVFSLVAPSLLGIAVVLGGFDWINETWGILDTRFFVPGGLYLAGIWESEPAVMLSFGPVMAVALIVGVVAIVAPRRKSAAAVPAADGREAARPSRARVGEATGPG